MLIVHVFHFWVHTRACSGVLYIASYIKLKLELSYTSDYVSTVTVLVASDISVAQNASWCRNQAIIAQLVEHGSA